jgi:cytochrome c
MGCRNPFRMGIDNKTGHIYWGDVGPDAGTDAEDRGPMGYDEVNQAREAGNFGWPYFRGNGKTYYDYDFAREETKELFNPKKPINDSPNNTGLTELPPFNPSMIWYSYDRSKAFPWVGAGGKNPMAGPVFHSDAYESDSKLPDFFDGRLFIYEWMRHWIYTIKFDSTGAPLKIDPFMQDKTFSRPMDMVFGPDGQLYMLEYGELWYARNMDARLVRIDFVKGNRRPVAQIEASKTVGGAPMSVIFSSEKSYDFDEDKLKYEWSFGDGSPANHTAYPSHTFSKPGIYTVTLTVTDVEGQRSKAKQEIQVGNESPDIAFSLEGNRSFYWDNRSFDYEVELSDLEDGSLEKGQIAEDKVLVSMEYFPDGLDFIISAEGHQLPNYNSKPTARKIIDSSDCKSCHAANKKVNGPSYMDISKRYKDKEGSLNILSKSILEGTSGKWGTTAMVAHPMLTKKEATEIADYILSFSEAKKEISKFPIKGKYITKEHMGQKEKEEEEKGTYLLMASYTDQGNEKIKSITVREQILLRDTKMKAGDYDESTGGIRPDHANAILDIYNGSHVVYKNLDLTSITSIDLDFWLRENRDFGGAVEARIDAKDGPSLGSSQIEENGQSTIDFEPVKGMHDLYLLFSSSKGNDKQVAVLKTLDFVPEGLQ